MAEWNRQKTLALLRRFESRNITFIDPDGSWPIVWKRAKGVFVWDSSGKRYLDLTAGFGVAAAGHANPRVVRAARRQMGELLHAMGDVHPHALKASLARELSRITFERWERLARSGRRARLRGKSIFCNSGFEAVEAALKTAFLATGKPGVIAFHGAYHGTGYGALNATHRGHFRSAFLSQLGRFGFFAEFPTQQDRLGAVETSIRALARRREIGAVLVEPVQGRGGINVPPPEFLPLLRRICDDSNALLVLDEVYTGFGRTGRWFACEHTRTVPDVVCLGKALSGGFPLSACVGRSEVMDAAWPVSAGEAIHTSTFLGHPVGCAMALAQIREISQRGLVRKSAVCGKALRAALCKVKATRGLRLIPRGIGLMAGLELRLANGSPATAQAFRSIKKMLQKGYILLPEGEHGHVISFTPPLTVSASQLSRTVEVLDRTLGEE